MISPDDPHLTNLLPTEVTDYLSLNGWQQIDSRPGRWEMYVSPPDKDNHRVEVMVPVSRDFQDWSMRLAETVSLLAEVEDVSPHDLITEIATVDSDVLKVRVPDSALDVDGLLSLATAARQIDGLRSLITYAAAAESTPRPYFGRQSSTYADNCRFGHTFHGSFGFTVVSPLELSPHRQRTIAEWNPEAAALEPAQPFSRKVMERIIRGLLVANQAVEQHSAGIITRQYESGLNGNMCTALLNISDGKDIPISYSVRWSPRMRPSPSVAIIEPITLQMPHYSLLEEAAEVFKAMEPAETTIEGYASTLTSHVPPLGDEEGPRWIIIEGTADDGRRLKVQTQLSPEEYRNALRAHEYALRVKVTGTLKRKSKGYELENPHDFLVQSQLF